jgi:hypothetical protein
MLTCGDDAPTLDLLGQVEWREERWLSRCGRGGWVMRRDGGCCRSCGGGSTGRSGVRRAMIIMASASGTLVPAIARLVAADEDTVRDVIHAFNENAGREDDGAGGLVGSRPMSGSSS